MEIENILRENIFGAWVMSLTAFDGPAGLDPIVFQ